MIGLQILDNGSFLWIDNYLYNSPSEKSAVISPRPAAAAVDTPATAATPRRAADQTQKKSFRMKFSEFTQ